MTRVLSSEILNTKDLQEGIYEKIGSILTILIFENIINQKTEQNFISKRFSFDKSNLLHVVKSVFN